jgi:hypothetical protein
VYKGDGEFVRYAVRDLTTSDEAPPYVLVRDLFPQKDYSGKRVMIHHDNGLDPDLVQALAVWGKAIKTAFYPVEVYRFGAPRVYALDDGKICQPPWGSAFKLNDSEALLVSTVPEANITPQPLRVRTVSAGQPPLPIERALRSVLVWTLLAYGADRRPKLPVTVINTDQLAGWLRKGNTLGAGEGVVPFWL